MITFSEITNLVCSKVGVFLHHHISARCLYFFWIPCWVWYSHWSVRMQWLIASRRSRSDYRPLHFYWFKRRRLDSHVSLISDILEWACGLVWMVGVHGCCWSWNEQFVCRPDHDFQKLTAKAEWHGASTLKRHASETRELTLRKRESFRTKKKQCNESQRIVRVLIVVKDDWRLDEFWSKVHDSWMRIHHSLGLSLTFQNKTDLVLLLASSWMLEFLCHYSLDLTHILLGYRQGLQEKLQPLLQRHARLLLQCPTWVYQHNSLRVSHSLPTFRSVLREHKVWTEILYSNFLPRSREPNFS